MSSTFVFPPPPPPPPKAAPDYRYADSSYSQNINVGLRAGRGGYRGRGQSNNYTSNFRGNGHGFGGHTYGGAGLNMQPPVTGLQYGHPNASQGSYMGYMAPYYPQNAQAQGYQPSPPLMHTTSTFQSPQTAFPQPVQGFNQISYGVNGQYPAPLASGHAMPSWGSAQPHYPTVPQSMGPPLRMGFDHNHPPNPSDYQHLPSCAPPFTRSGSPSSTPGYKRKREGGLNHRSTLQTNATSQHGSPRTAKKPKVHVAPPVPSFGMRLPVEPPAKPVSSPKPSTADVVTVKKRRKKKRKSNQLGLTPQGEEHEESEEEVDEEALFKATGGTLQFEYNGKTSNLGSAAEIVAWIAERKKRWPTKARAEAAKQAEIKRQQEQQEAREKAQDLRREMLEARQKEQSSRLLQQKKVKNEAQKASKHEVEKERRKMKLEKHLRKAEKLRKQLEHSENETANFAMTSAGKQETADVEVRPSIKDYCMHTVDEPSKVEDVSKRVQEGEEEASIKVEVSDLCTAPEIAELVPKDCFTTSKSSAIGEAGALEINREPPNDVRDPEIVDRSPEPTITKLAIPVPVKQENSAGGSAETSSDDSSSESLESSDSSSDDEPVEASSKSGGPVRVRPPTRDVKKKVCHHFLRTGYCKFKKSCKYRHELPERGTAHQRPNSKEAVPMRAKQKKTLFQRLVEQEQAIENEFVLKAIKSLGDAGAFEKE